MLFEKTLKTLSAFLVTSSVVGAATFPHQQTSEVKLNTNIEYKDNTENKVFVFPNQIKVDGQWKKILPSKIIEKNSYRKEFEKYFVNTLIKNMPVEAGIIWKNASAINEYGVLYAPVFWRSSNPLIPPMPSWTFVTFLGFRSPFIFDLKK